MNSHNNTLEHQGYDILSNLYTEIEVDRIIRLIEGRQLESDCVSKTKDVFAIRQLLNVIPELHPVIFNPKLQDLISKLGYQKYFVSKAIYFDKPPNSNWFVAYHQDLSISIKEKFKIKGFHNWTFKKGQHGVQPPLTVLENTFTIRIHLDNTNEGNGALRVIPNSHKKGIIRIDEKQLDTSSEITCKVPKGGIMLMKPLTLHASSRTTNNQQRRVIHLEFSNQILPNTLEWLEYSEI